MEHVFLNAWLELAVGVALSLLVIGMWWRRRRRETLVTVGIIVALTAFSMAHAQDLSIGDAPAAAPAVNWSLGAALAGSGYTISNELTNGNCIAAFDAVDTQGIAAHYEIWFMNETPGTRRTLLPSISITQPDDPSVCTPNAYSVNGGQLLKFPRQVRGPLPPKQGRFEEKFLTPGNYEFIWSQCPPWQPFASCPYYLRADTVGAAIAAWESAPVSGSRPLAVSEFCDYRMAGNSPNSTPPFGPGSRAVLNVTFPSSLQFGFHCTNPIIFTKWVRCDKPRVGNEALFADWTYAAPDGGPGGLLCVPDTCEARRAAGITKCQVDGRFWKLMCSPTVLLSPGALASCLAGMEAMELYCESTWPTCPH